MTRTILQLHRWCLDGEYELLFMLRLPY